MKATCGSCGKAFMFDDSRFGERASVKVRCPSCKGVVALTRPAGEPAAGVGGAPTQKLKRDQGIPGDEGGEVILPMPKDRRVSLAVLSGKNSGQIINCQRSRVVIGRSDADVAVEDDEVSRRHAAIEIRDDRYFLKDLGSTNGTFVEERKITETEIFDKGEFRVGSTQLMLIITANEDVQP